MGFWVLGRVLEAKIFFCERLCWKYLQCERHLGRQCIRTAGLHTANECTVTHSVLLPWEAISQIGMWSPILIRFYFL